MRRIESAASKLGDRSCARYTFRALRTALQLSVAGRVVRQRVVARRVAVCVCVCVEILVYIYIRLCVLVSVSVWVVCV